MTHKLTIGVLALGLAAGTAWAQNLDAIQNTRSTMKALQKKQQIASDAALGNAAKPANQTENRKSAPAHKADLRKSALVVESSSKAATPSAPVKSRTIVKTGGRDPFVSPVVNQTMTGSGCSVGKRCLAIGEIALKGIVQSDNGMIAVVVNAMDKAYFLRENDPVFNGYVLRITGDSIVFKENMQDRLGKPFTREVIKKITNSAV